MWHGPLTDTEKVLLDVMRFAGSTGGKAEHVLTLFGAAEHVLTLFGAADHGVAWYIDWEKSAV